MPSNDPTIEVIDNSDLSLAGVSLRDPVVDKQWLTSRITDLYWQALKSDKTPDGKAKQLVIELVNEEQGTSTEGKIVAPGTLKTKVNIYATPVGGLTQEMVDKKIVRFQTSALGLTEGRAKFGPPEDYIGKMVKAYYEAEPSRDGDGVFQRVNRWQKA